MTSLRVLKKEEDKERDISFAVVNHHQMEESSNGKFREILKVETGDGDKEVSGEFKTEAETEAAAESSVRVIVINENPEPNESLVRDSVIDSVEPEVSSPSEGVVEVLVEQVEAPDSVAELESMVIDDSSILQSLHETNRDSKLIEETIVPSSDANDGSSPVETEGIEQIPLPSPDDIFEVPPATADVVSRATEGTNLPALEQNPEESSGTADLESKIKVDESSQEAANAGSASTENQPVTSLSQLSIQPTSWRSCCGLLEILRRSDR